MKLSVIVTTNDWCRLGDLAACAQAIAGQAYDDLELVVPIDHSNAMRAAAGAVTRGSGAYVTYDPSPDSMAAARNLGASEATGDIYAFVDDDAMPSRAWASTLVEAYREGAIAAGGPAIPVWPPGGRPSRIPRRFDWLVGCGPYHDDAVTIRNTYGCNISFRADVFHELGGFDESLGKGTSVGQGEEADLAARMVREFGEGTRFCPGARVYHRVDPSQLSFRSLSRRAYEQGRTKRVMGTDETEGSYLREIVSYTGLADAPFAAWYSLMVALGYYAG